MSELPFWELWSRWMQVPDLAIPESHPDSQGCGWPQLSHREGKARWRAAYGGHLPCVPDLWVLQHLAFQCPLTAPWDPESPSDLPPPPEASIFGDLVVAKLASFWDEEPGSICREVYIAGSPSEVADALRSPTEDADRSLRREILRRRCRHSGVNCRSD
jgi:hypothetical protein